MTWIGRKRLALIPVHRPSARPPDNPVPADWAGDIMRRMIFDPNTAGMDRSLRTYIHTASSGLADLDAVVYPMQTIDAQDVPPDALESQMGAQLRAAGFDAAALVMLGGPGAGTGLLGGYWARFVMLEDVGVWAMEFMHCLTGFGDLYTFGGNMGRFDEMAASSGSHPSAYTKVAIGWLAPATVAQPGSQVTTYDLHSIGLVQPPPSGRVAAVRIGSQKPYLMIEARQKVDQFEGGTPGGIPNEGVIIYQVQTSDPLGNAQSATAPVTLLTNPALQPGGSFTALTGLKVEVLNALPGGFSIRVTDPALGSLPGQLLFYRDTTQNGTGDVNTPLVIGQGGWNAFKFLFSGGNGIIYAVNQQGQLLFYRDTTQNGTGDVNTPAVIGQGGWGAFKFLFSGGNGIIYAVNQQGQLLFYRDTTQNGTGDVNTPKIIGQGGWGAFKFLFSGGNGIIYAVNQQGQLLFYRDTTQNGTGDVNTPKTIGQGGWAGFKFLFSAGNGIIYAVNPAGQLLFYRDTTQNGTGDVNTPATIGQGGWQAFSQLFSGGNGIIYAVKG